MIEIDYQLSEEWSRKDGHYDLGDADETALRYNVLLGDVKLRINGAELGTDFGWVPLVDFAACLKQIAKELGSSPTGEAVFDFTESDAAIRFVRRDQNIEISASYAAGVGCASFNDFVAAVDAFVARVRADLSSQFPSLKNNHVFSRLMTAT